MIVPFKSLLQSRKFVVAVLTSVLTPIAVLAARFGLDLNIETTVAMITPPVLAMLAVISGISKEDAASKAAGAGTTTTTTAGPGPSVSTTVASSAPLDPETPALPPIPPSPRGFVMVDLLALVAVAGVLALSCIACGAFQSGAKTAGGMIVDCLAKQTAKTVAELGPVVDVMLVQSVDTHNRVDFNPVKDLAKRFSPEVGGCVLADAIARALKPKPDDPNAPKASPLEIDREALRADFEALRAEQFGGKHFKTPSGDL